MNRPQSIERMIEVVKKLPGVGPKMAERLCYHILKSPSYEIDRLIEVIQKAKQKIKICSVCYNVSETDPCPICADNKIV